MILESKKGIKRFAIFFFYDNDGIVDDYIPVLLDEVKKNIDDGMVVCNGKLDESGRKKFEKFSNDILVRDNVGFDVWAYKEALEHIGWQRLEEYDEVILMNYTIFGPIYSFGEMFESMNKRDLDFWGITKHHMVEWDCFGTCKYNYIPEHIQSSFIVIRQSLMKSDDYHQLWENMPMIHSYGESVGFYEAIFTKEFNEKGYKSAVYVDTTDLEGYTRYPLMFMARELVENRHCPIIKVKNFSQRYYDMIGDTLGEPTVEVIDYIKDNSLYDIDLIWQHILRTANMADIKKTMHLNYILPKDHTLKEKNRDGIKIAVMVHLYYEDLIDKCLKYIKNAPEHADLIITTPKDEVIKALEKKTSSLKFNDIKIIKIENIGRDVSSLLVGCKPYVYDYDYVCFVHDKKTTQIKPYCVGESFGYKCWENNLGSRELVENIIATFEDNPRLGLLTPPPPNHATFYHIIGGEWANNYNNTLELAYKLGLKCHVYWDREPIAPLGTMFWFRPKAMKTLFDYGWKYEDFPKEPNGWDGTLLHAVERIYGYVVQHEGYYPAWVLNDKFARIEITNLNFMLRELNSKLFEKYFTNNLFDMTDKISRNCKFVWSREVGFKGFVKRFKKYIPPRMWEAMKKVYLKFKKQ